MQISITYSNPADQAAADLRAELRDAACQIDTIARRMLEMLDQVPAAAEPGDVYDLAYIEGHDAASAIFRLGDVVRRATRRI